MTSRNPFAPFVNWFDPRGEDAPVYQVIDVEATDHDGYGYTDKENGVFAIPWNDQGRVIAQHELGHVMWSPVHVPVVSKRFDALERRCYQVLEEARVGMGLARMGLPLHWKSGGQYTDHFRDFLVHPSAFKPKVAVLHVITTFGTDYEEQSMEILRSMDSSDGKMALGIVENCMGRIGRAFQVATTIVPSDRAMRILAKWLANRLRWADEKSKERVDGEGFTEGIIQKSVLGGLVGQRDRKESARQEQKDSGLTPRWQPAARPRDEDIQRDGWVDRQTYRDPTQTTFNGFTGPIDPRAVPGSMTIEEPPRPLRCDELERHRKRVYDHVDQGSRIGDITRIITDQRIFKSKRKKSRGGGTVLFDLSGSMGNLRTIIGDVISGNKTATTCATYSGYRLDGVLRVIVRNGTKVEDHLMYPPSGVNNIVDLPALDWLSRQPAPRVWVSDQCVTGIVGGVGGSSAGNQLILDACHKLCDSFNITILDSPLQVSDHLKEVSQGEKATGKNVNAYGGNG